MWFLIIMIEFSLLMLFFLSGLIFIVVPFFVDYPLFGVFSHGQAFVVGALIISFSLKVMYKMGMFEPNGGWRCRG